MSGAGFEPEATLALPGAMIAVMGPEAAVNAVYFNKLEALRRASARAEEERLRAEFREDIDIERLAPSSPSTRSCRTASCAASWSRGCAPRGAGAIRRRRSGGA
jgi:hypothetical protein